MTNTITVSPTNKACGAEVTGIDISKPLSQVEVQEIREAWLKHHVLAFPDQRLSNEQFERLHSILVNLVRTVFWPYTRERSYSYCHSRSR